MHKQIWKINGKSEYMSSAQTHIHTVMNLANMPG